MKAVRGMHDLFGEEIQKWKFIERKLEAVFHQFGYQEIRTPVLEDLKVFSQTVGDETDIVEKQMYQVAKENETLVLRPEGTAGFIRAVIEHQLQREGMPQRYYYYLPMFRHERPQKGRLRQFHQYGAEFIGDASPEADAEIIALLDAVYQAFGLSEYEVRINSVGCIDCRPVYKEKLQAYFSPHLAELCPQCQKRFERSPLRILDCKSEACQKIAQGAPLITDSLCVPCKTHHTQLKKRLDQISIRYIDDPQIVRGLDYYSRTAFEFTSNLLGAQSALGGGGRYDGIANRFGEKPFPGVGFGLGMERLVIALEAKGLLPKVTEGPTFYFAALGAESFDAIYPLAMKLRRLGHTVEMPHDVAKGLKSHLKNANRLAAKFSIILGENELKAGQAALKDMAKQEQTAVSLASLESELIRRSHAS